MIQIVNKIITTIITNILNIKAYKHMSTDNIKDKKPTSNDGHIQEDELVKNNKKCKKYFMIEGNTKIYFNADFDSGNLQNVEQLSPYVYKLSPGYDKVRMSTQKTYFHFKVFGFQMCTVRFHITRVAILEKLLRKGQQSVYKPIVKKGKGKYQSIEKGVQIYYNRSGQAELSIEYEFNVEEDWTEFAFSYPYSYEDLINLVKELKIKYIDHSDIYFHQEVLAYTKEGRKLQIITITDKRNCLKQRQQTVDNLFPDCDNNNGSKLVAQRPFKINKPIVIISGRVHPGQTPASYCIQGLLRFLLDEKDYRSYLLRKNFHFIIVPMLNPDGVYHGMFRNDLNGQNLNRLYLKCSKKKHPTIWSFREYLKYLQLSEQPVMFYFDFHAHPSKKQFFIYGNAFNQFTHQVEAETFGKLLQNNCPYFHNIDSIFSQKQMGSKDKHDQHTKQGCGRVFTHKLFGIIHSYTVECGYFAPDKVKKWQQSDILQKQSQVLTQQYAYVPTWEKYSTNTYTPQSYMFMGKTILITILDLFHLNPYTRINSGEFRSVRNIRKNVGAKIYNAVERFRLIDSNVPKKIKEINKILQEDYYKIKVGAYGLSISQNYGMKHPKKTFSLNSRVYLSREERNNKIKSLDKYKNQQNFQQIPQNPLNMQPFQQSSESSQRQQQFYKSSKFDKNLLQQVLKSQAATFKQIKQHIEYKIKTHNLNIQQKQIQQKQLSESQNHSHSSPSLNLNPYSYVKIRQVIRISAKKQKKDSGKGEQHKIGQKQIIIDKDLMSRTKRVSSQTNIINKYENNRNGKGLSSMIEQIQQNISASLKSQRSESRLDSIQKNKQSKKQSKIELFLKKQQANPTKTSNDKVSDLEKYVTQRLNQQNHKNLIIQAKNKAKIFENNCPIITTSRFPNLNTKQVQNNIKSNSSKNLRLHGH